MGIYLRDTAVVDSHLHAHLITQRAFPLHGKRQPNTLHGMCHNRGTPTNCSGAVRFLENQGKKVPSRKLAEEKGSSIHFYISKAIAHIICPVLLSFRVPLFARTIQQNNLLYSLFQQSRLNKHAEGTYTPAMPVPPKNQNTA